MGLATNAFCLISLYCRSEKSRSPFRNLLFRKNFLNIEKSSETLYNKRNKGIRKTDSTQENQQTSKQRGKGSLKRFLFLPLRKIRFHKTKHSLFLRRSLEAARKAKVKGPGPSGNRSLQRRAAEKRTASSVPAMSVPLPDPQNTALLLPRPL